MSAEWFANWKAYVGIVEETQQDQDAAADETPGKGGKQAIENFKNIKKKAKAKKDKNKSKGKNETIIQE